MERERLIFWVIVLGLIVLCGPGKKVIAQEFSLDVESTSLELSDDTAESTDLDLDTEGAFFPDSEPDLLDQYPELSISLYDIWFNRYEIIQGGSFIENRMKRAEEEFKRFNEARLDRGIKGPKLFSAALTREGFEYIWANDPISAIDSFSKAIVLDQTNAEAFYGRAQAHLAKSKLSLVPWLRDMIQGYFAQFGDFWLRFFYIGNIFFTLLIGVSFWFLTLIVVLLIKYYALFLHDVEELIPIKLNHMVITVIGWAILLIPLLLGKGLILLLLFWLVLIWVYLEKPEKIMSGLLVILLFSYPFLLDYGISFFQMYNKKEPHAILASYYGTWDPKIIQFLEEWSDEHPSDMEPYFLLGMLYRKQGDFFRARDEYEKALRLDRTNAVILNNLGNIYYFLNDYQQAIEYYKKAANYNLEMAAPHFNLSKAYLGQFDFSKADQELTEARRLNKEQVDRADLIASSTPNRKLIDEYLPADLVWKYLTAASEERREKAKELWSLFVVGIPLDQVTTWVIALIVITLLLEFIRKKFGVARHCLMCGCATCKRCQRHLQSEKYCGHCMQLFIKKDGVDPRMRNEKMMQVHKYKKKISFISRILSLIVPGWGHIYCGYSILGGVLSLLWISLLARWFYSGKIFVYPYLVTLERNLVMSGFIILVMIALYIVTNLHLHKVSMTS
ncbi:tetratricopeptide repeat protein [bacterium]|nr:tetratricopeptide repeat protein [bacterium]